MKYFLLFLIRIYQIFLSPSTGLLKNFYFLPHHCRFEEEETCSIYAYRVIKESGSIKGSKMAFLRFCRCSGFIKN
ncbi:MAG TPA: membrane protein insertion efficiency factor YidD [Candidatus Paceibacterota bacterium]|jgi:putative component of membrane protein insertase Oxa1/YidC/SpoIIIJ protein YidD|nr:membrane protein insertion efficiency factor YidD [Parcubacteria group bacterium]HOM33404.1 membrane protein insertion efficiency factor YidD [Candidatus Paceibacterota bacterium]HPC37316.1 membrane protein insertion efficiency factor YidD [Candidatus Paceibacterota bacterium]